MTESTADLAASVTASVTGAATPDNVNVNRPTKEAVWTLFVAMGGASLVGLIVICILAFIHWPDATAQQRIFYLGLMGLTAIGCIPVIVISLASSRLGHVEASAGNNKLELDGRQ